MSANTSANNKYNVREFIAFTGAKVLQDKTSVFVGTGLPMIAAILAQKTHAPQLLIIFEAGGVGPILPELPISVGQGLTYYRGVAAGNMFLIKEIFLLHFTGVRTERLFHHSIDQVKRYHRTPWLATYNFIVYNFLG